MRSITITAAALVARAALAASSSTTQIPLFDPGDDTPLQDVVGSVVNVKDHATTLVLDCPAAASASASASSCAHVSPITVTVGPSTFSLDAAYSTSGAGAAHATATISADCDITSSTQRAVCTAYVGVTASETHVTSSSTSSAVSTYSSSDIVYQTLSITAGAEKLPGSSASATASAMGGSSSNAAVVPKQTGLGGAAAVAVGAVFVGAL